MIYPLMTILQSRTVPIRGNNTLAADIRTVSYFQTLTRTPWSSRRFGRWRGWIEKRCVSLTFCLSYCYSLSTERLSGMQMSLQRTSIVGDSEVGGIKTCVRLHFMSFGPSSLTIPLLLSDSPTRSGRPTAERTHHPQPTAHTHTIIFPPRPFPTTTDKLQRSSPITQSSTLSRRG